MRWFSTLIVLSSLLCGSVTANEVRLADDGKAMHSIIVSPQASAEVQASAALLAKHLGRISGATFDVQNGDGARGIVVGLAADFSAVKVAPPFDPNDPTRREEYLIRSHADGLWLLGATDLAVRHAVWDCLYEIGYRQYFPGPTWEIVPRLASLRLDVDRRESPDYHSRRIWYGYGPWDYAKEPYRDWCEKNRAVQGIELNTGHAYDGILGRNRAAFAEHPEFLGLVGGERRSTKFCIANPGLRQLVADDALAQLAADPAKQSVSVDPSDGGGWCECAECAKLGGVSDRAVTLANTVAEAVTAKHPEKLVGMYAYNEHSPPPTIDVHPAVVISVATSFIHGGFTIDQLLAGWSQRANMLGIREYYSVSTWDRDLPGAARGGNVDYLRRTIPHFHKESARFLSAESSDNWAPNGLGYFLASRMLWDVGEAERVEELTAGFLNDCFGSAREPIAKFYGLLDTAKRPPLSDDLVGRMYRLLHEARGLADDGAIQQRLDDLTLYVRYVELWLDYSIAAGTERQTAFEAMIRHTYRMRTTMMIHSLASYRDVDSRDKSVTIPDEAKWNVPQVKNPWKDDTPFARAELDGFVRDGIANRKLLDFTPASFSGELVPAAALNLTSGKLGSMGSYSRQPRNYFSWVEKAPATFPLNVTAGIIYQISGPAKLDLYPAAEAEAKSVAHAKVEPTREVNAVELKTTFTGLHRLEIIGGGATKTEWPEGLPMTIESSFERPGGFHTRWSLYFYVPRGTKLVGGFGEGPGKLLDADGKLIHTFDDRPGYFSVPVPPGQDGRLWKFDHSAGDKRLMTVPPYLARSAAELLLPAEVVRRDSAK